MTTYTQHQVSEIKNSNISSIHSQPTTPTENIKQTIAEKNHHSNL